MASRSEEEKKPEVFCVPVQRRQSERGILGLGEGVEESRGAEWYLPDAKILDRGVSSSVHEACKRNQDCDYVMKIMIFNPEVLQDDPYVERPRLANWGMNTRKHFLKEVELQKEAFRLGVAPEIIDSWLCENPDLGVIIMPALRRTLKDVLIDPAVSDGEKKRYINDAWQILILLNKNNIFHGDSHLKNFMVDSDQTLKIIDFGLAKKLVRHDDAVKPRHSSKFFQAEKTPMDFLMLKSRLLDLAEKHPDLRDIIK